MSRWPLLKNLLAALGAVIAVIFVLSVLLSIFFGGSIGGGSKVAVVKLEGVITDATEINRELEELSERRDVAAVVLRIDSPGGAVGPSQEIYSWVKRLRSRKPVVASMGTIAASGGYYAAVATDRIVANPGTITGSIGVLIEFINAEELLGKLGVKGYVVKSGRYKDTGSPFRPMTTEERKLIQGVIDDVNKQFITAVSEGRGLEFDTVAGIADGRIFTGSQALARGLVDELGDLTDAIDISARLAGIEGKPYVLYPEPKGFNIFDSLFGESSSKVFGELFTGFKILYLTPTPVK